MRSYSWTIADKVNLFTSSQKTAHWNPLAICACHFRVQLFKNSPHQSMMSQKADFSAKKSPFQPTYYLLGFRHWTNGIQLHALQLWKSSTFHFSSLSTYLWTWPSPPSTTPVLTARTSEGDWPAHTSPPPIYKRRTAWHARKQIALVFYNGNWFHKKGTVIQNYINKN
jgi:hypothetical protein